MEDKDYILLFERFIRDKVSVSEREMLKSWIGKSTSKNVLFAYYLKQWNEVSTDLSAEIQYRMLENIKMKMHEAKDLKFEKQRFFNLRDFKKAINIAVAACILGIVSFSTYYFTRSNNSSDNKDFVVTVSRGQKASVELPDGSKVWLNSDSKLSYSNAFNIEYRKVNLQGEAYFEVAKNKKKRFIVSTKNIDIEALGTVFNIKSYNEDSLTTTTLIEGKLRVSNDDSESILYPQEMITYNSTKHSFAKKQLTNIENTAQWRNDHISFAGESLGEIAITLERMYDIEIVFASDKVRDYRFSGIIRNNSLSNVFEVISLTAPIKYKISNQVVEIQENK
jgi:ferric-dicitrate binding protein FerR (iron transport regulator)